MKLRICQCLIWALGMVPLTLALDAYPQFSPYITAITIFWSFIGPHYVRRTLALPNPTPMTPTATSKSSPRWAAAGIFVSICFVVEAIYKLIIWVSAK